MRTTRRLATLVLAASAGLTLAACSSTIEAKPVASTQSAASEPTDPPMEEAADTQTADSGTSETGTDAGTSSDTGTGTGTEEIPEPGAGIPGDEGLCQAVAGWYGYVGLSLLAVDASGEVDPADVVPLLEALRDAPESHQDAGGDVRAAAADVSDAADEVIGELESGADAYTAIGILDQPITDFATACSSAGVDDF
jgi:hypothetical protein